MNKRDAVRYQADLFPESMAKVTVSWDDFSPIEANVIDYCANGLKVSIPSSQAPVEPPQKDKTVRVQMPNDEMLFSGMCVSAKEKKDGSLAIRIFFYNPHEQNHLKRILCKSLQENHKPGSFVSHEWEEVVDTLCNSDDPKLKKIGISKRSMIEKNCQR